MADSNVREYLVTNLEERMKGLYGAVELLASMVEGSRRTGRAEPIDFQAAISCYRGLAEVVTLLGVYNDNFYDTHIKRMQENATKLLATVETNLNGVMVSLVNSINRAEQKITKL